MKHTFLLVLFLLFSTSLTAYGESFLLDSLETKGYTPNSVGYIVKKAILHDFDSLTYDNFYIEKAFQMPTQETTFQGMAVFNDYMFQCHHSNNRIDVYDLRDYSLSFTIEQEGNGVVHCNNADFGKDFYDKNDPFPLLYLEQKGNRHKTSVYRIIRTDSTYTAQMVQTLTFEPCTRSISNNDLENGFMYVTHGHGKSGFVTKIKIPSYKKGDMTIDLKSKKALATFDVSSPKVGQDATIHNNKLFQLKGYSREGEIKIVDLERQCILFVAQFNKIGMNGEPEGIAWYKDHLIVSTVSGQVYNVYFVE